MFILEKNIKLKFTEKIEQIEVNLEELESLVLLLHIAISKDSYEANDFAGAVSMLYSNLQSTREETICLKDFYKKNYN